MVRRRVEAPERPAVFAEDHGAATAQVYLRMGNQESHLKFQPVRIGNIVGVHSGQVTATRTADTFIQSGRQSSPPSVTPADHARVAETLCDGQTPIIGTVVAE